MANIRGNYFRPAATCGIGASEGRVRLPVDGVESHPESQIRDFSPATAEPLPGPPTTTEHTPANQPADHPGRPSRRGPPGRRSRRGQHGRPAQPGRPGQAGAPVRPVRRGSRRDRVRPGPAGQAWSGPRGGRSSHRRITRGERRGRRSHSGASAAAPLEQRSVAAAGRPGRPFEQRSDAAARGAAWRGGTPGPRKGSAATRRDPARARVPVKAAQRSGAAFGGWDGGPTGWPGKIR